MSFWSRYIYKTIGLRNQIPLIAKKASLAAIAIPACGVGNFRVRRLRSPRAAFFLYLSENAVHHPVDAGGTDAVGGADAALLQVLHYALYERQLDMLGVLDMKF